MSQLAVDTHSVVKACAPAHAPGSAFFAAMAGVWGALVALLAASPATLDDAYAWLTGLPIVWEILMWIVTLPWTIAYLVYDSSWEHWLRVLVVVLIVAVHLGITAPRAAR
jgi:hypothetical protein